MGYEFAIETTPATRKAATTANAATVFVGPVVNQEIAIELQKFAVVITIP
jgi:hypothetical protein